MTSPKTFSEETVASLKLCKTLWELSAWGGTELVHRTKVHDPIPAYSAGYLLRKLPSKIYLKTYSGKQTNKYPSVLDLSPRHDWNNKFRQTHWSARYLKTRNRDGYMVEEADTPEDALAKLSIELWKQGVLK